MSGPGWRIPTRAAILEQRRGVLFRVLLRNLDDEETFVERHPTPALLIEPYDRSNAQQFETGRIRLDNDLEPDVPLSTGEGHPPGAAGLVHPDAWVAWLIKSERNPFAGLITIGRARNNDIVIPSESVSKVHAILHPGAEGWRVEDRKSTNGTSLDGTPLEPWEKYLVRDRATLILGDQIRTTFCEPASLWATAQSLRGYYVPE
jgi:hypothetical protein